MKVFIKTFGCRVNQVESQAIKEMFAAQSSEFVKNFEDAQIAVLNTCTVTSKADADIEKMTRQILSRNPRAKLVLTGCYAAAHVEKIKKNFPKAQIIDKYELARELFGKDTCWTVSGSEGRSRAFVKIQDGCDCFCSYCIVPFARNKKISKPMADVTAEIQNLISKNFHEIVLTGINIGNYKCPVTGADIAKLTEEIFKLPGKFRLRFSSIEVNTLTDNLVAAAKRGGGKFCNYFHIPLQSGCDKILKDMNRRYTAAQYAARIAELRKIFPDIGIYADVIAGYPTETDENFDETYNFISYLKLSGLHVFSFSPRPMTAAAKLTQLPPAVIKNRADKLRALDKILRNNFAASQVGRTVEVLAEKTKNGVTSGVSGNFLRINFTPPVQAGSLLTVKTTSAKNDILLGAPDANRKV
ncbi:MAG: MiaB/RimO family radical SAM methylthiotransferase [Elusimicrobia bacterium]|nr:MiaB/RimO family radical SAM methylthiotransferase [Elusimicrobiota bacterium]